MSQQFASIKVRIWVLKNCISHYVEKQPFTPFSLNYFISIFIYLKLCLTTATHNFKAENYSYLFNLRSDI